METVIQSIWLLMAAVWLGCAVSIIVKSPTAENQISARRYRRIRVRMVVGMGLALAFGLYSYVSGGPSSHGVWLAAVAFLMCLAGFIKPSGIAAREDRPNSLRNLLGLNQDADSCGGGAQADVPAQAERLPVFPPTATVLEQGDVAALTSRHIEWRPVPGGHTRRYQAPVEDAVVELQDDSSEAGERYVVRRGGQWVGEVYRWPAPWKRGERQ